MTPTRQPATAAGRHSERALHAVAGIRDHVLAIETEAAALGAADEREAIRAAIRLELLTGSVGYRYPPTAVDELVSRALARLDARAVPAPRAADDLRAPVGGSSRRLSRAVPADARPDSG